jgi:hypothetical protein
MTFLHAVDEECGVGGEIEGGVPLAVPAIYSDTKMLGPFSEDETGIHMDKKTN